jgi:hypothetical protein
MSLSSVERPVSALRQRMLEDMAMRGLRSDTQRNYVGFVRDFAAFLGRAPGRMFAGFRFISAKAECSRPPSIAPYRRCASFSP